MLDSNKTDAVDTLGLVRFLLSISVIAQHVGGVYQSGLHAVEGFFCISGYLITRTALLNYRGRPLAFLANRILRIYPQYLVAVLIGLLVAWQFPEVCMLVNNVMQVPVAQADWWHQFIIFGLYGAPIRLSPPTWSLNVEVYFYLIIGLVTYRFFRVTLLLFVLSLAWTATVVFGHAPLSFYAGPLANVFFGHTPLSFYGSPLANAFAFFLGSLAFHLSRRYRIAAWMPVAALLTFVPLAYALPYFVSDRTRALLLILSTALLFVALLRFPRVNARWGKIIGWLGRLSYPIFLFHWAVFVLVRRYTHFEHHLPWFLLTTGFVICLSILMVWAVDLPIERLRQRVRRAPVSKIDVMADSRAIN